MSKKKKLIEVKSNIFAYMWTNPGNVFFPSNLLLADLQQEYHISQGSFCHVIVIEFSLENNILLFWYMVFLLWLLTREELLGKNVGRIQSLWFLGAWQEQSPEKNTLGDVTAQNT